MELADGRLLLETSGAVAHLTLNQPERLNAVSLAMWRGFPEAMAAVAGKSEIRVLVIRGAGGRAFASGADISEFEDVRSNSSENREFTEAVENACQAIMRFERPVLASIDGYCIGGGMVIASACDIRLCSGASQFGVPAARLGLAYELENVRRLQDIVGPGWALDILSTGRRLSAAEALASGFVTRVCAKEEIASVTAEYAEMIARNAPLTLRAAKMAVRSHLGRADRMSAEALIDACFDSQDFIEGRKAFAERRPPVFQER